MRLACQEHLLPGASLQAKWEFAVASGFDGIELRGAGDFGLERRLPELRAARRDGVVMPSVCVAMDYFIGDFDAGHRRDAVANMRSQLSVMAEIGGRGAITPASYGMWSNRLPPFEPPRSPQEDRAVLLEGLAKLGAHAAAAGVELWLEPLNRYEDHMVNTLDAAASLCADAGARGLGVMADFFHMNIEEADIAASLRRVSRLVRHVQLSDSNRLQPGAGHLDFRSGFAALSAMGFDGWMAFECRLDGDAAAVLPKAAAYVRDLWPKGAFR
jgi:sugar phosphate isomerase/epimerase